MKKIVFTLILFGCALTCSAQTLTTFKQHLSAPIRDSIQVVENIVQISEQGNASAVIAAAKNIEQNESVAGYRVVIYMGNSQSSRGEALAARNTYAELFPDSQSKIVYENPYFKVVVGACISQDEVIILLGKIKPHFPKAFSIRDNIAINELTK